MSIFKLQKLLFYLIVFLIPCNLAKHWPQDWSYVHGILVDYLIPTVYLTDILILALLFTWILESLKLKIKNKILKTHIKYFKIFLFVFLVFGFWFLVSVNIVNKPAAFYKLIKLIEFGLFALWIKQKGLSLHSCKNRPLIKILSLSVIWQSVLAIAQWFKQGSVFGYWFFGEQPYTSATLGIKKISLFGQIKVLPMGTFPHPNVLAGFLVISLILILSLLARDRVSSRIKFVGVTALFLGVIALGLTFSLPAWVALLVAGGWWLVADKTPWKKLLGILGFLSVLGILGVIGPEVEQVHFKVKDIIETTSLTRRTQLNRIAIKMWQSSPIFGIGLNNFIPRMEEFGKIIANYRFLQPVHNIFLLVLSETGLIGLIGLISLIGLIGKKLTKSKNFPMFFVLCSMFFLGLFDHYFLTIQQGMLVVSMILGLILSETKISSN